jgi:hypothetical protein
MSDLNHAVTIEGEGFQMPEALPRWMMQHPSLSPPATTFKSVCNIITA